MQAKPPLYRVVDLGATVGRKGSATAISDAGHVVGWFETPPVYQGLPPLHEAFAWHSGVFQRLGTLGPPYTESEALDVNSAGHVVGWTHAPANPHAFVWLPSPALGFPAGFTDLGTMGGTESRATAINERSEIAVVTNRTAFVWLPNSSFGRPAGMNDLCGYSCGSSCCDRFGPLRMNDQLQIVESNAVWLPEPRYGRGAGWSLLRESGPDNYFFVADLNNSGVIAANWHGFAFSSLMIQPVWADQPRDVISSCSAGAINDQGMVIGSAGWRKPTIVETQSKVDASCHFLNERLVYSSGWRVEFVNAINNLNAIAGSATNPSGIERAVLLRPVDPDIDWSGSVNQGDFLWFSGCLSGPGWSAWMYCERSDLESDGDVDLKDFQALQLGFEGSN